ncbi:hypothetical protein GIB67_035122 [Kingdonia uniflora]|uniref:Uncharacterized protein n=1 Tax=Kingdonia uniflora TaxID=39325 RepID=A0A7J7M9S3_9MAGN|nr:hypothetical protein GIB67_023652 [Kingdonia uniflora]KAF6171165.1 hypothetical protein GIB67_035122 [Kingdonia uniflora]
MHEYDVVALKIGEVTGTSHFKFQVRDLVKIVKFPKWVFKIEGPGSASNSLGDLEMGYEI